MYKLITESKILKFARLLVDNKTNFRPLLHLDLQSDDIQLLRTINFFILNQAIKDKKSLKHKKRHSYDHHDITKRL